MSVHTVVHIVSVADNHYVQHLAVAFASALANLSKAARARLYVVGDGLSEGNRAKLSRTVGKFGAAVRFLDVDGSLCGDVYTSRHITRAVYYKLLIPEAMKDVPIDKAIYLDCDTVVTGDLSRLWEQSLGDHPLAAVQDPGGSRRCKELGIPREENYFNAGVLVLNLPIWREERLSSRVLEYVLKHPERLKFHDQDGLNAVLHQDWLKLDPEWNFQTNMLPRKRPAELPLPRVIHFTGSSKPWEYDNDHPFKDKYYEYLAMTEWTGFSPAASARRLAKRWIKRLLPPPVQTMLAKASHSLRSL